MFTGFFRRSLAALPSVTVSVTLSRRHAFQRCSHVDQHRSRDDPDLEVSVSGVTLHKRANARNLASVQMRVLCPFSLAIRTEQATLLCPSRDSHLNAA